METGSTYKDNNEIRLELINKSKVAYKVFSFICNNAVNGTALVISMDTLVKMLRLSRKTIQRAIKLLKEDGWICVYKIGNINAYMPNSCAEWYKDFCGFEQSQFSAHVIISREENPDIPIDYHKKTDDAYLWEQRAYDTILIDID